MQKDNFISHEKEQRTALFTGLYKKAFPLVAAYVSKMGGSAEEAKDVFQDALVAYYEKAAGSGFQLKQTEIAYVMGTAKYIWIKKYKDNSRFTHSDLPAGETDIAGESEREPAPERIVRFLEHAGQKCMDLLSAFYYHKKPLQDIAELFGFSGVRSATVQKYKCLEKVRNAVKEKSMTYEDFLN